MWWVGGMHHHLLVFPVASASRRTQAALRLGMIVASTSVPDEDSSTYSTATEILEFSFKKIFDCHYSDEFSRNIDFESCGT